MLQKNSRGGGRLTGIAIGTQKAPEAK